MSITKNAVELTRDDENVYGPKTYIKFMTVASSEFLAEAHGLEFGDPTPIEIMGRVVGIDKGITMGRGWARVHVEVNGGWRKINSGGYVDAFVLGGNHDVTLFEYVEPQPEVIVEEDSESDVEVTAFGDMPDPESVAGYQCMYEVEPCTSVAQFVGLLHVSNPTPENPDGVTAKVTVCTYHSLRWIALWGAWPIENDSEFGVPTGSSGEISRIESRRRTYAIDMNEYATLMVDAITFAEVMSTGAVSLAK